MDNAVRKRKPSFFLIIAIVGLFAVLIGFAKTFIITVATNNFSAPLLIHIHGAFSFGWILLFLSQTSLIHFDKYKIHQTLGYLGLFIAAGVIITMIPAGMYVVQRDLKKGFGDSAYSSLLGVISSGIIFFSLVVTGILKRRQPEFHKRLMLLATIVVLWPAWFRFRHYFPSVPRPDIWFALILPYSLIIIAWIWDKLKNGSVHPILKYIGLLIIFEQTFEMAAFDSLIWRQLAKWSYNLLSNIA